jgi:hypothetical protein
MITREQITVSHDTKKKLKILFSKVGSEKERTEHIIKYVEER